VVRRVGSAIALGLLGDGEQLPAEAELATLLNVSTVTLRDALAELRASGWSRRGEVGRGQLRALAGGRARLPRGRRLAELATTDLRELGELHGAVAAAAARLAASRASVRRWPGCGR
jgi:DNA-binding FadR family transcriptional regulator